MWPFSKMFINLSFLQCNKLTAFSYNMMYFQTIINTTHVNNCCQWDVGQKKIFAFVLSSRGNALWISLEKFDLSVRYYKLLQSLQLSLQTCKNLPVCMLVTIINFVAQFLCSAIRPCLCCQILCCCSRTQLNIFVISVTSLETTLLLLLIYFVSISHHSNVLNGSKFLFILLLAQQYVQKTFDHGVVSSNFLIVMMERKCMDWFDDVDFLQVL